MKVEEAFGIVLKKERIDKNLSQEKLAFKSDLDRTTISLLERGKRKPTIETIFSLATSLNLKPSYLISETENLLNNER